MSEKTEVGLKEEDRKLLLSLIDKLNHSATLKLEEKHEHEPPKKAESAIEHIDTCPTCRNQFKEKLRTEILKDYGLSLKGKQTVKCKTCGLNVAKTEEKCPGCGSSEAD